MVCAFYPSTHLFCVQFVLLPVALSPFLFFSIRTTYSYITSPIINILQPIYYYELIHCNSISFHRHAISKKKNEKKKSRPLSVLRIETMLLLNKHKTVCDDVKPTTDDKRLTGWNTNTSVLYLYVLLIWMWPVLALRAFTSNATNKAGGGGRGFSRRRRHSRLQPTSIYK